ncbi:MAG: SPOR domain-containing protein [Candidatus Sedimenticola sp. (ex Thyasira tokunagai)]
MNEGLKKRLVGATVLVSLAVIFVPMLLEKEPVLSGGITESNIPPRPNTDFTSRVLPLENENLAKPSVPEVSTGVTTSSDTPPRSVATQTQVTPKTTKSLAQAAAKPQPATQVEPRVGLSAWVVQVGSFSKRENAARVEKQLKRDKFPAFIEQVGIDGKNLFRVKVGPEVDHKLAEDLLRRVNKALASLKLEGSLTRYQ